MATICSQLAVESKVKEIHKNSKILPRLYSNFVDGGGYDNES